MVTDALSKKTMVAMSLQHSERRLENDEAILAQLIMQPILKKMMINAQKNDVELQMVRDYKTDFSVKEAESLYF